MAIPSQFRSLSTGTPSAPAPPTTWAETLFGEADTPRSDPVEDAYRPVLDTLGDLGYDGRSFRRDGQVDRPAIWAAVEAARKKNPKYFANLPQKREQFEGLYGTALNAPEPRGLVSRSLYEAGNTVQHFSPLSAIARSIAGALPATEDYRGGGDNSPAALAERARARVTQRERDDRERIAATDAQDPALRPGGGVIGNVARLGAKLAGGMVGSVVSDPTALIAPGKSVVAQIVGQAGIAGAGDLALQGGEVAEGVRDAVDPVQSGLAAVMGGGTVGLAHALPPITERILGAIHAALPEPIQPKLRITPDGRAVATDDALPDLAEMLIGRDNMTTGERAAVDVARREHEIASTVPYADGANPATWRRDLDAVMARVTGDAPSPVLAPRARLNSGTAGAGMAAPSRPAARAPARPAILGDAATVDRVFESIVTQESGGRAGIAGQPTRYGTAHGSTQVLDSTGAAMAKRLGIEWRPELMRSTTAEGAAYQRQIGRAYFEEGLRRYDGDLRKAALFYHGGPNEKLWGPKTRAYADEVIARAGGGGSVDVGGYGDGRDAAAIEQQLRDLQAERDGLDAQRRPTPTASETIAAAFDDASVPGEGAMPPMTYASVPTSRVTVDAALMQFKSGGDAFGVTDRLAGVTDWNPAFAGRVILWERADGTLIAADGHQRVGLAKRIGTAKGRDIPLDAVVLREADGVSAGDARMLAALKNISEGTGSAIDAAKVIREGGSQAAAMLPPRSALARDGAALARLSPDAFGAVVNNVVRPDHAAIIGQLLPGDPAAHLALIDLLAKTRPANRTQAESIVRDGIAAGFSDGVQTDMFGAIDNRASLFLERAQALDGAIQRMEKLKSIFRTTGQSAATIEAGGVGRVDAARAAQEAASNATSIDLVKRLANSADGPFKSFMDRAARRLADGEPRQRVVDDLVTDIRSISLRDAVVAAEHADRVDAIRSGEEPTGRDVDTATFDLFADPNGPATAAQTDSMAHDVKAAAAAVTDGPAPFPLDQRFQLDDDAPPVTGAQLLKDIDAEDAAIEEVKKCL